MRVGIIGGGQLGMMLCQAAKQLNLQTTVLDPNVDCSASGFADDLIVGNYDDQHALAQLAVDCDVVTYEFENVSTVAIDEINQQYKNIVQTSLPLKLSNDRLVEKQAALASGFNPVPFAPIDNIQMLEGFIAEYGYPVVLKTRRFGYDGKGQYVLKSAVDLESPEVLEIIRSSAVAEQMIELAYETSVISVRNSIGDCRYIPSTINTHRNNILHKTETMDSDLDERIYKLVEKYLDYHNLIGIITVEVFVTSDQTIYFNEIAPRPHNSGHYSIEGCNHSQFDLHLRAICDLELPIAKLNDKTVMINVLGQDYIRALAFISENQVDGIYFHDYYKQEIKNNRKMAHITAVGTAAITALSKYEQ